MRCVGEEAGGDEICREEAGGDEVCRGGGRWG